MAVCYDNINGRYDYCSSHLSTYVAVGVIIPLSILIVVLSVYLFFRCRQRRLRQEQQTYMATIIPIYNNNDDQQLSFNYPYPPHYASMLEDVRNKPPSYEQTIQQISETENRPTIHPVATTTPAESRRNQN